MDMTNQVQIPDEVVCSSCGTNGFVKGMNPIKLFKLDMATGLGEGQFWIQICLTSLK